MNRRDVLRVAGVAGTLVVAGCLGDDDSEDEETTPTATPSQTENSPTRDDDDSNGDTTPDENNSPTPTREYDDSSPTAAVRSFVYAWQDGNVEAANELIYDDGNVSPIDTDPEELQQVAPEIESIGVVQEGGGTAIIAAVLYTPARDETVTNRFELVAIDGVWRIGNIIDQSTSQPVVSFGFERDGQTIEISHETGDGIRAGMLRIRGAGVLDTGTWDEITDGVGPNDLIVSGDSTTVEVDSEYTVQVLWESGDQSVLLGVFDGETSGSESDTTGPPAAVEDHLSDANGYDGTITDMTGDDSVTLETGAGQAETFQFAPPAVRIDVGTELTWEWVSDGHTVTSVSGPAEFDTDIGEEGFQFSHTFEEPGIVLYECVPHSALGMLGAVVVEDPESSGGD
jgi:halocyanin-like protein